MGNKLHELLAVEADLEGAAKKILAESIKTFKDKPGFFTGMVRELKMFEEGEEKPPVERQEITTTVVAKLDYTKKPVIRWLDAVAQKERTNQDAKADLVVDGAVIAKEVPATLLLALESRLKLVKAVYDAIPTLAPGKKWELDESQGPNVYRDVHPEEKYKTKKTFEHKVLYNATKEHPAQIERWEETKNVGKYVQSVWSGMISPAQKSRLLGRIDKLLEEVKKARQRANNTDVVKMHVGKLLFDYIHQDVE